MAFVISWLCVALFIISMLSGVVVAFVYKPSLGFESVQMLTYIVPYGKLFRELHYFSSEAFFVFTILHLVIEMLRSRMKITTSSWNYSIFAFFLIFALMFTGYVLKSDLSGYSAAQVAISLIKQTPILSDFVVFIEDKSMFFWKFYIWHILFLPLLLAYGTYKHINTLYTKYWLSGLGIAFLCMLVFTMPLDISYDLDIQRLHGPWFFWGAEGMLLLGIPVLVVDLFFVLFFALITSFYFLKQRKTILFLLLIWVGIYAYFSFI